MFPTFWRSIGNAFGLMRTTQAIQHASNDCNPLVNLAPEIILIITSNLDKEFQVLLSLSCKRFYYVLNTNLDLSLHDLPIRVRFLQHLEPDHPEFLTCRACGWMFLWRKRRILNYWCPRPQRHANMTDQLFAIFWERHVYVEWEVVDLISRGPKNGLPISYLNSSRRGPYNTHNTVEACWIDGQIVLTSRWTRRFKTRQEIMEIEEPERARLCWHRRYDWKHDTLKALERQIRGGEHPEHSAAVACAHCHTVSKVLVQVFANEEVEVQLSAWLKLCHPL